MSDVSYQDFCEKHQLPVFYHPWWLDLVLGNSSWDVIQVSKGDKQIAVMPFSRNKKFSFDFLMMPPLTPYQGPWIIIDSTLKYQKKLSAETSLCKEIIEKLPEFSRFDINFHPDHTNTLPFYWAGFESNIRYTHILEDLSNLNEVYASFRTNVKRNIKSSEKALVLNVDQVHHLLKATSDTYERQNKKIPVSVGLIKEIVEESIRRNAGKVYSATDNHGNLHAALFVVWDKRAAYYLIGGGHPQYRRSGAMSWLMWIAIKEAAEHVNKFDFEGSMVEPIAHFFRGFGAKQASYAKVTKINSNLLRFKRCFKTTF